MKAHRTLAYCDKRKFQPNIYRLFVDEFKNQASEQKTCISRRAAKQNKVSFVFSLIPSAGGWGGNTKPVAPDYRSRRLRGPRVGSADDGDTIADVGERSMVLCVVGVSGVPGVPLPDLSSSGGKMRSRSLWS